VVGLLATVGRGDELRALETLETRDLPDQRTMHAEIVIVETLRIVRLCVQHDQLHRHSPHGRPTTGAHGSINAMVARVAAVSRDQIHRFSKVPVEAITLVEGMGVAGDAHAGTLVQHRSRVRRDPNQPNLRQVHLIHAELLDEARAAGHEVGPGALGENILTAGLDLLALPTDTRLIIGDTVVRVTGLRNPCRQINSFSRGLLKVVVARRDGMASNSEVQLSATGGAESLDGIGIVRKAGVMAVVERGGEVRPGLPIEVALPEPPHRPLAPV
jgi:MOSC domain-containing protein YiiM